MKSTFVVVVAVCMAGVVVLDAVVAVFIAGVVLDAVVAFHIRKSNPIGDT